MTHTRSPEFDFLEYSIDFTVCAAVGWSPDTTTMTDTISPYDTPRITDS